MGDKLLKNITYVAVLICGGIILVSSINFFYGLIVGEYISSAELGDFLGGYVGAILSVFTVLLLWYTYKTQNDKLNEQIEQQKQQLNLLKKQTSENKKTAVSQRINLEIEFILKSIDKFEETHRSLLQLSYVFSSLREKSLPLLKLNDNTRLKIEKQHYKFFNQTYRIIDLLYISLYNIINKFYTPIEIELFASDAISKIPRDFFILTFEYKEYLIALIESEHKFNINNNEINDQIEKSKKILEKYKKYHVDGKRDNTKF